MKRFLSTESDVRVLLVEDSPEQQELVRLQLGDVENIKFNLSKAHRLAQAVEILASEPIDIILLDLSLPDSQGLQSVTTLKSRYPSIPLVVLTGTDDEILAVQSLREGAEDYLVKEAATPQVLKRVLTHAMERHRVAQALASSRERFLEGQKLEALGRLAGGIAHDFNNVLMSIIGFSDILVDELEGSELQQDAEEIRTAGERASELTRQILAFSRRDQVVVEPLNLNTLTENMRKMLDRLLPRGIKLHLQLEPNLPSVLCSRGHLEQVLLNLVVNARDAISECGEIDIRTSYVDLDSNHPHLASVPGPGRYVALKVSDTGSGIPEEVQKKIFEPFFTTKPTDQGTGLGLSTVFGIVKSCQGGIAVDSVQGQGTTFSVFLAVTNEKGLDREHEITSSLTSTTGETVLVLDEQESLRKLVLRVLGRAGYNVLTASCVSEARKLADDSVDLLLLPKSIEGLDGEQFAKSLLQDCPLLRALIVVSHTAGSDTILTTIPSLNKPFTPGRLLTRVREVMDAPSMTLERLTEVNETEPTPTPTPITSSQPPRAADHIPVRTDKVLDKKLQDLQYVISHDLQEPVRMINSYLTLLSKRSGDSLGSSGRDFLAYAQDGGRRLEQMIRGILRLSRLHKPSPQATCNTNKVLDRLKESFAEDAERLVWTGSHLQLPLVETHLFELLYELVDNGLKFQEDEKDGEVVISSGEDGAHWYLTVRNEGVGFPEGGIEQCLELFKRLHTRDEFSGVGFGLAYCAEIARMYGGRISIAKEEEGGRVELAIPKTGGV